MKTRLIAASFALVLTLSQNAVAAESRSSERDYGPPALTEVKWIGTLRCGDKETDAEHRVQDHDCDLQFLNDETGESWNVKADPALTSAHRASKKATKVHIEALQSPRYLLGGSYIRIKRLEILGAEAETAAKFRGSHLCSL